MKKYFVVAALAALAACGGSSDTPDAAPSADAAPIDVAPDAAPPPVHVHAQMHWPSNAGLDVLFHDVSGHLIGRTTTDASGDAIADVPDGSSITIVPPAAASEYGYYNRFRTIRGVVRGTSLVIAEDEQSLDGPTATMPAYTPAPYLYEVSAGCLYGSSDQPSMTLAHSCVPPTHGAAMAVALSDPNAADVLGWLELTDTSFAPTATLAFPGPWQAPVTQSISIANVQAGDSVGVGKFWYRGGIQTYSFETGLVGGDADVTLAEPGGGDTWRGLTSYCKTPAQCQEHFYSLVDPLVMSDDVAAPDRLPWIEPATVTLAASTVAWTMDDVPATATAVQYDLWRTSEDPNDVGATWVVLGPPPTTASVTTTLPELPDDLDERWYTHGAFAHAYVDLWRTETESFAQLSEHWFASFYKSPLVYARSSRATP